jgi:hypothetical protein
VGQVCSEQALEVCGQFKCWPRWIVGLCLWAALSVADAIEIQPRPVEPVEPGGWVRLHFDISDWYLPDQSVLSNASLILPSGWSVLVPPRFSGRLGASGRISTAIAVSESAQAGLHEVRLTAYPLEAIVEVGVLPKQTLEWNWLSDVGDDEITWWSESSLRIEAIVKLSGNVRTPVRFASETSANIDVRFDPKTVELQPGQATSVTVTLNANHSAQAMERVRFPLKVTAHTPNVSVALAEETIWIKVWRDPMYGTPSSELPVQGYFTLRHQKAPKSSEHPGSVRWDWGLTGHTQSESGQGAGWRFALHSDPRRERSIEWRDHHWQLGLGRRIFGGEGLSVRPQLGVGASMIWSRDELHDSVSGIDRFGLQRFSTQSHRFGYAWVERGPWRFAWVQKDQWESESGTRYWPTIGYVWRSRVGVRGRSRLTTHWSRYQKKWSGMIDYQLMTDRDHLWYLRGQSISLGHPSQLPPGHWLEMGYWARSQEGSYSLMGQVSRDPITGVSSESIRLYSWYKVSAHHGLWAGLYGFIASRQSNDRFELQMRSDTSQNRWLASLDTHGSLKFKGTFHLRDSWYGLFDTQSDFGSIGLQKRNNHATHFGFGTQWSTRWNGRSTRGYVDWRFNNPMGIWSLSLDRSLSQADWNVWLTYVWRQSLPLPKRDDKYHATLSGRILRMEEGQSYPIRDAVIAIGDQEIRSDVNGNYRLPKLAPGPHSVQLTLPKMSPGWLLTSEPNLEITMVPAQEVVLDWAMVRAGEIMGHVVGMDAKTLSNESISIELIGECEACPLRHRYRLAKVDERGQFHVSHLMPGRWQWQIRSSKIPPHHQWTQVMQVIEVFSGQRGMLHWVLEPIVLPTQWQIIGQPRINPK